LVLFRGPCAINIMFFNLSNLFSKKTKKESSCWLAKLP